MRFLQLFSFIPITLLACYTSQASSIVEIYPRQVDLGQIWEGERIEVTVKISNEGNETIVFDKPQVDCPSCIEFQLPKSQLEAGSSLDARVSIVHNKPGQFKNLVIIKVKSPEVKPVPVSFSGNVRKTYYVGGSWYPLKLDDIEKTQTIKVGVRGFSLSQLPDLKNTKDKLEVFVLGVRPQDPFVEAGSFKVESGLFNLSESKCLPLANGRLYVRLLLQFKQEMTPGLYYDSLMINIGENLRLSQKVSFRILGDVWPEKSLINFGVLRRNKSETQTHVVKIHFRDSTKLWDQVEILAVEPTAYQNAISIAAIQREKQGIGVKLTLNTAMLPITPRENDKFFFFSMMLGDKHTGGQTNKLTQETDRLRLYLYGMLID